MPVPQNEIYLGVVPFLFGGKGEFRNLIMKKRLSMWIVIVIASYAFCVLCVFLRVLPAFVISWFFSLFSSISMCRNTAGVVATLLASAIIMWMGTVTMGKK